MSTIIFCPLVMDNTYMWTIGVRQKKRLRHWGEMTRICSRVRNSVEAPTRLTASCFHKGLGSTLHALARLYASSHSGKRCANSVSSDIRDLSWCKPSDGLPITRAERSEETAAGA